MLLRGKDRPSDGEGSTWRPARFAIMAEEFDRGWYLRKGGNPFTPTSPMFFAHAQASEAERLLIRDRPAQRNGR